MARKRASLRDKGEEILGLKRRGQGADIIFGLEIKPANGPTHEDSSIVKAPQAESMPSGEADLEDEMSPDLDEIKKEEIVEMRAEPYGLPQGEADLNDLDLERLLGAESKAAEGDKVLPELATVPAASAPPPFQPATPSARVGRPLPAPPPVVPATSPPIRTLPKVAERPAPAPPPPEPIPSRSVRRASRTPVLSLAAAAPPPTDSGPPRLTPSPTAAPPSTATGAPDLSVPRPLRYIQMVGEDFDLLKEETSEDAEAAARVGEPGVIEMTEEEIAELLRREATQEYLAGLDQDIDGQYERILREDASISKPITDWAHNMLAEARAIVLSRQIEKLPKAEWNIEQVRARLDRAYESRKNARRYSIPILLWGFVWFVAFVYLIFNPSLVLFLLNIGNFQDALLNPQIFLQALFFGGIGGVAAVFYHLFKYMRARSFDSQFVLSYFGKPIMGMIVGSITYLTLYGARFVGLAVFQGQQPDAEAEGLRLIIYVVAIATGFKENLAFDLLNRTIKAVLGSEDREEEEKPKEPQPATP